MRFWLSLLAAVAVVSIAGCGGSSEDKVAQEERAMAKQAAAEERARERAEDRKEEERVDEYLEQMDREFAQDRKQGEHNEAKGGGTAGPSPKEPESDLLAKTCGTWPAAEATACETAYSVCLVEAEPIVRGYYEETGVTLDQYATSYAEDYYGTSGWSQEAAYQGCLAALFDEYDRIYE